jgi:hypothetical protein
MNLLNGIAYLFDNKLEIDIWGAGGESLRLYVSSEDERCKNMLEYLFDNFSMKVCRGMSCDVELFTSKDKPVHFFLNYEIGTTRLEGTLDKLKIVNYDNFPWRCAGDLF